MGTLALIGMGSNLGDRRALLDAAIGALAVTPGVSVRAISRAYETEPVGGPAGQGTFLNAAVSVETTLDPRVLLAILHEVERRSGRIRKERWGERTLDLDLLLFGGAVIDTPTLRIPHPRMALRRFVLAPLAEIAPESVDPLTGRTVSELLANLDRRPGCLVLTGPSTFELFRRLAARLSAAGLFQGTGSDRSYEMLTGRAFAGTGPDWRVILEQKTVEFHAERWSARLWGERWLVTDFWFDRIYHDALSRIDDREDDWRERFLRARGEVLPPTFLVATHPRTYWELRRRLDPSTSSSPIGREIPVLWPGTNDDLVGFLATGHAEDFSANPEEIDRFEGGNRARAPGAS